MTREELVAAVARAEGRPVDEVEVLDARRAVYGGLEVWTIATDTDLPSGVRSLRTTRLAVYVNGFPRTSVIIGSAWIKASRRRSR